MSRVYLDWNATAPLRPEAREAMIAAMDVVGNPSSVHAEGRAAKMIVEKARGQVAALVGCEPSEIVFTSGATEAVTTVMAHGWQVVFKTGMEHPSVHNGSSPVVSPYVNESVICFGDKVNDAEPGDEFYNHEIWEDVGKHPSSVNLTPRSDVLISLTGADGETGLQPNNSKHFEALSGHIANALPNSMIFRISDITQILGKRISSCGQLDLSFALCSAHKLGGPKGVGALFIKSGVDLNKLPNGGGQEAGRRSGTENVIGIAGFGAAAEAAQRDLENGVWENVEKLRDQMEDRLAAEVPEIGIFGKEAPRLPNTSNFAIPGWKGETQVMQMDLAGFAVSAGSACSSGKVKASRVLQAMGFDENTASSAIRVSIGPTTSEAELMAFADTWIEHYRRFKKRAA